jgi:hypothetical protein
VGRSIQTLFFLQTVPAQRVRTGNIHQLCKGTFMNKKSNIGFPKGAIVMLLFSDDIGMRNKTI